jgi:hypothetical protein
MTLNVLNARRKILRKIETKTTCRERGKEQPQQTRKEKEQ